MTASPPNTVKRRRFAPLDRFSILVAALAAALVALGWAVGWRGGDLPAQIYRVALVRHQGFTLWDSQWYGGHWTLNYSVLFPVTAAVAGWKSVSVVGAAAAALAFDRLAVQHFGRAARAASVVFAVGVIVQTSIGQLSFFLGEALGLWCVLAATRRRWIVAGILAIASSLASPLAGAFVALAGTAWAVAEWSQFRWPPVGGAPPAVGGPRRALLPLVLAAGAALPIGIVSVLFPGEGNMPYPLVDWAWELAIVAALWAMAPRRERVVRTGLVVYAVAATVSFAVPSPVGGNVGRLEDCLAFPVAVLLCWSRLEPVAGSAAGPAEVPVSAPGRPAWGLGRRRILFAVASIPLVLSQWAPAWGALSSGSGRPWTHRPFYTPLVSWLGHAGGPSGRVEVVPTRDHWEAAYVAPAEPLARGWERQLDIAYNPLFYDAQLTAAAYRSWLVDNGVRYVALADAPLDYAGAAEGRLVAAGVAGLPLVWRNPSWRVYRVTGAPGIVSGPAQVALSEGARLTLAFSRAGSAVVRVRWSPAWQVRQGVAEVEPTADGWMTVTVPGPETVALRVRF